MRTGESEPPITFAGARLGRYRHVCAFFNTRDEEYRVFLPFIKEGLSRGEKAFHIVDPTLRHDHVDRLFAFRKLCSSAASWIPRALVAEYVIGRKLL